MEPDVREALDGLGNRLTRVEQSVALHAKLLGDIGGTLAGVHEEMGEANARVDRVSQWWIQARTEDVERFGRIEQRLERVEARLDHVEQRLERLEQRVERLEQRVERLEQRVDQVVQRIEALAEVMNSIAANLDKIVARLVPQA